MRMEQLRYFVEVCEKGSINMASYSLHLAQQSLNNSINSLEQEIGTPLLEKSNKGIVPTSAGIEMYNFAQHVLDEYNALRMRIYSNAPNEITGVLRIGALYNLSTNLLPELTVEFLKRYPKLMLQSEVFSYKEIMKRVSDGSLDIGFVHIHSSEKDFLQKGLRFQKLFECKQALWVSNKSPLCQLSDISMEDVSEYRMVVNGLIDDRFFDKLYLPYGITREQVIVEKNLYLISKMVEEDLAVCPNVKVGDYGLSYEPYFKGKNVSCIVLKENILSGGQKDTIETGYLVRTDVERKPLVALIEQYFKQK